MGYFCTFYPLFFHKQNHTTNLCFKFQSISLMRVINFLIYIMSQKKHCNNCGYHCIYVLAVATTTVTCGMYGYKTTMVFGLTRQKIITLQSLFNLKRSPNNTNFHEMFMHQIYNYETVSFLEYLPLKLYESWKPFCN